MHAEQVTETNREAFYQLYVRVFGKNDDERTRNAFFARFNHAEIYQTKLDEQVIAGLYAIHLPIIFHGAKMGMRGIGVVMSDPNFRGQGGPSKLMRQALQEMNSDGVELSYLAPFSYTFYRRFGYEQVFNQTTTTFAKQKLPEVVDEHAELFVTKGFAPAEKELRQFYVANETSLKGGLDRADWWWDYLVTRYSNRKVLLRYDEHQQLVAYAMYEVNEQEKLITVAERAALTPHLKNELLLYLNATLTDEQKLEVVTPNTRYWAMELPEPDHVSSQVEPYMMARVVNVPNFVAKYPFKSEFLPLSLKLTDPVIEENNGIWRLDAAGATKERSLDQTFGLADFELTIERFSQLMLGAVNLQQLVEWNEIVIHDQQKVGAFAHALVSGEPELVDYF